MNCAYHLHQIKLQKYPRRSRQTLVILIFIRVACACGRRAAESRRRYGASRALWRTLNHTCIGVSFAAKAFDMTRHNECKTHAYELTGQVDQPSRACGFAFHHEPHAHCKVQVILVIMFIVPQDKRQSKAGHKWPELLRLHEHGECVHKHSNKLQ